MKKMKISEINEELKWSFGKYRIVLNKEKQGMKISVSQKMLFISMPLYHIFESELPKDDELTIAEKGKDDSASLILAYDNEDKGIIIKKGYLSIFNNTGYSESIVMIEL